MPSRRRSAAGPIPESISSFGDSIVPAQTTTSCPARACRTTPPCTYSTPTQRVPSKRSRHALAEVSTVRFVRVEHGTQEGLRDTVAPSVADVQLAEGDALELGAVRVVVERDAGLLGRLHRRRGHRVRLVARDHRQRPAGAVVLVRPAVEVLGALEERQDVVVPPAVVPARRPAVVVAAVAAHVDHPVERARPAEHPPARPVQLAPRARDLRNRPVAPVLLRVPELEQPRGIVDRGVVVRQAGLEEQHARPRVDEPPGHDRARRARADDHDVGGGRDFGVARHGRLLVST